MLKNQKKLVKKFKNLLNKIKNQKLLTSSTSWWIRSKIYHFLITKLGKRGMSESIETIIIRAPQDFDAVGGLNPIQIEIKDDRITNLLK